MASIIEKIRAWVGGEEAQPKKANKFIEEVQKAKRYESEQFLQKVLLHIDEVLRQEIIRLPSGKAYVPNQFIVYLNEKDDRTLRKDKREFFAQALSELMLQKAKERAGKAQLNTKTIKVTLRVNATLNDDEIEVIAASDELGDTIKSPVEKKEKQSQMSDTIEDLGTIEDLEFDFDPLYRLEIFRAGTTTQSIPILKREITIGRDVEEKAADVRLKSDNRKISRLHAKIEIKNSGEIWVTALNKNPTIAGKKTIRNDETVRIETDEEIQIYEFTLRLKFKE
jgi:hypothetical protein